MIARLLRVPKGMLLLLFGLVFGIVWAAGLTPGTPLAAAGGKGGGGISISQGDGIAASPNPITSVGTIAVDGTVSRVGHTHDDLYIRQTGGIMSGDLAFTGNTELIAPRIENATSAPVGALAGRLYFDTADLKLKVYDGATWVAVPQLFATQNFPVQTLGTPDVFQDLNCAVTFTLPSDGTVLLEAGALGELDNLVIYTVNGIRLTNQLEMDLEVSFDGTVNKTLATWRGTFDVVGPLIERKLVPTVPVPLAGGTHTARLLAKRSSSVGLTIGGTVQPGDYQAKISQLWMRIHRP